MSKTLISSRTSAFIRQGGLCCYCYAPMWLDNVKAFATRHGLTRRQADSHRCTAEHLLARCEGGADTAQNIAAACSLCNLRRHCRRPMGTAPSPQRYRAHVLRRVAKGRWRTWAITGEGSRQSNEPLRT